MNGGMGSLLYIVVLFGAFWFLLIRPQQAQQKKRAAMMAEMKLGDNVVTIGGICGKVTQITADKVFVEVSEGIVVEFLRNAISTVVKEDDLTNPFEEEEEDFDDLDDLDDDYYYDDEDVIDVEVENTKK